MLAYPCILEWQEETKEYMVTFPDIPEAVSVGEDKETALIEAVDGLLCGIDCYVVSRRPIPLPSQPKAGQETVEIPAMETAKILLHNEMLAQGVKKAEMARRLDVHMPQIDRLLNLNHSTQIEFIERAAAKLGKKLSISLQ